MSAPNDHPEPVTVLHVDGYPAFTELSASLLERASPALSVETVQTADGALDVLRATDVDCVVSGYDLPETDGLALLDRVRPTETWLPFVLFTACREPGLRREAVRRGATAVVPKETDPAQFEALADRIVALVVPGRGRTADVSAAETATFGDYGS